MEDLKEYVKNIDFEIIGDLEVLDNVYEEIHGHENDLILNVSTTYQIENLIRKSNSDQILNFVKRLDIGRLINKKLGSRVLEVIYDVVFDMVHVQKQMLDVEALIVPTEAFLEHRILDTNATHVIRKLFQLVSGKKIYKNKTERFRPMEAWDVKKYKETILAVIPRLSKEDGFVTLLYYLRCYRSQSVIYEAIQRHFDYVRVCEPTMSYFFENLVKLASKRGLEYIFEGVKDRVMDLCRDKYANYFVGELILRYHNEAEYFFNALDLSEFEQSSNIVMKLVQSLQKIKSYGNIDKIMKLFYLGDDEDAIISHTFGGVEGNFKQKYAPMLSAFMRFPDKHNYNVNTVFRRRFSINWIRSKGGIELLQGYYEGTDGETSKRQFTRRLEKYITLMSRRDSVDVLKHMLRYTSPDGTKLIKQELEKQKRK